MSGIILLFASIGLILNSVFMAVKISSIENRIRILEQEKMDKE